MQSCMKRVGLPMNCCVRSCCMLFGGGCFIVVVVVVVVVVCMEHPSVLETFPLIANEVGIDE